MQPRKGLGGPCAKSGDAAAAEAGKSRRRAGSLRGSHAVGCCSAKTAATVLAVLLSVSIAACACWQLVSPVLAWLADAGAVRGFVAEHAFVSRVALVGVNVLQIVLAFLPGEPIELASGYAFGFWEGTALCLVASAIATTAIYWGMRRWGSGLVGKLFGPCYFERFSWLRDAKRVELAMLVVFLVPGTPKDFLTYFAGLIHLRFPAILAIATLGRIPSIVTSTLAASAAGDGDWVVAGIAMVAAVVLLLAGVVAYRAWELRGRG